MRNIPKALPADIQVVADMLRRIDSQEECLQKAYSVLTQKYYGNRLKTLLRFFDVFPRSLETLWSRNGFLHCTNLNWLLRTLLVKSGHFTEQDIITRWTLLWCISPHQYVQVRMKDGQHINIDLWAKAYGICFGDYAHGFHAYGKNQRKK